MVASANVLSLFAVGALAAPARETGGVSRNLLRRDRQMGSSMIQTKMFRLFPELSESASSAESETTPEERIEEDRAELKRVVKDTRDARDAAKKSYEALRQVGLGEGLAAMLGTAEAGRAMWGEKWAADKKENNERRAQMLQSKLFDAAAATKEAYEKAKQELKAFNEAHPRQ